MRSVTLQYLKLEVKRTGRALFQILKYFIIMVSVILLAAGLYCVSFHKSLTNELIRVGLVINDSSQGMETAFKHVSAIDTVGRICSFENMEEKEAEELLEKGELDCVIILPENFYRDINTGINTPATVLFSEKGRLGSYVFREFMEDGVVSMIDSAESGIYAVTEASFTYGMKISREEMEYLLTKAYALEIFGRGSYFDEHIISPFGEIDIVDYYCLSALFLILLLLGLYFGYLYSGGDDLIEKKLIVYGVGSVKISLVRTAIMATVLMLVCYLYSAVGFLLFLAEGKGRWIFILSDLPVLFFICMSIAGFFNLVYSVGRNPYVSRRMLLIMVIILVILSGAVIPLAFLPTAAERVFSLLPGYLWFSCIADVFKGAVRGGSIIPVLLYGIVFIAAGMRAQWKKVS